jgi:hypothetical protein
MKRYLITSIFSLVAAGCFAVDAASVTEKLTSTNIPNEKTLNVLENTSTSKDFFYVRMDVADTQAHVIPQLTQNFFMPKLGLGYRMNQGVSAIDISTSYGYSENKDEASYSYYANLPKVSYLRYVSPRSKSSIYYGAGAAVVAMRSTDAAEFVGIVPSASVGFEMNRDAAWHSFVQLDVSQPAIAAIQKGKFPGPLAEIAVGAGF